MYTERSMHTSFAAAAVYAKQGKNHICNFMQMSRTCLPRYSIDK